MKPQKKTETILREYWSCAKPEHRHRSEKAAYNCIEKHEISKDLDHGKKLIEKRLEKLKMLREWVSSGETLTAVSQNYDFSFTTCRLWRMKAGRQYKRITGERSIYEMPNKIPESDKDKYLAMIDAIEVSWKEDGFLD